MRFTIEQRFAADVDAVARAYADPELYAALVGLPEAVAARRSWPTTVDGDVVHLEVRYRFER